MKKYAVVIFFLLLFLLCSCSGSEQKLDQYYDQKREIESLLKESSLSEKDEKNLLESLASVEKKIEKERRTFAVTVSPEALNIEGIPYASEDINKIGEWYYKNLIYPLSCYEPDYASLFINKEENFTSQEKFYIISYHLLQSHLDILTEKYSYLDISSEDLSELALDLFGESVDSSLVMQYSSETDSYSVPFPTNDSRLLVPIFGGSKLKDVTNTEITVNYAEPSLSRAIYSETFVFDRRGDSSFSLHSRVRNNQSTSLVGTGLSNVSKDDVLIIDSVLYIPEKIEGDDLKNKGELLSLYYGSAVDNYNGAIFSYDYPSMASLINMILFLQPDIEELIVENALEYTYFGLSPDYLKEQTSVLFGNIPLDEIGSEYYHDSLDLYLYKISDLSGVSYHKQVLNVVELSNGFIRIETALFRPNSFMELVAKEVIIFSPQGDGMYQIFSRHYNRHTASYINVIPADIVPAFPEVYPDTSPSDTVKGTWLYKNYGKLLDFEFSSCQQLSSERLAVFALERLFETEGFSSIQNSSNCYAFPRVLIEEQIRLFFGDTNFVPEQVSFYDLESDCFFVNSWKVKQKETPGTVISAGSSEDNIFTVHIELPIDNRSNDRMRPTQYVLTFSELENKSFRFVSAQVSE